MRAVFEEACRMKQQQSVNVTEVKRPITSGYMLAIDCFSGRAQIDKYSFELKEWNTIKIVNEVENAYITLIEDRLYMITTHTPAQNNGHHKVKKKTILRHRNGYKMPKYFDLSLRASIRAL